MGDHFQIVVDLDATPQDAPRLARLLTDWLVAEGIVRAERTDCVLGQPLGHPPGPNWHRAVAPADADDEPYDGLAVHTGRTVFTGGQGDAEWVRCPRCATTTRLHTDEWDRIDEAWEPFEPAIGLWATTGTADVRCAACAATVPITDWTWGDDYYAPGHLGLEFWNWPPFADEFLSRLAERVDGHRLAHVRGKL